MVSKQARREGLDLRLDEMLTLFLPVRLVNGLSPVEALWAELFEVQFLEAHQLI